MFKEEKYSGEIWFPNEEINKCFCVLTIDNDLVELETNLYKSNSFYKEELIYGIFTGLGYVTFLNNRVKYSESGLVEVRKYLPEYTFSSGNHFINLENLAFKEFIIENPSIISWIRTHLFSFDKDLRTITYDKDINDVFNITDKNLTLEINTGFRSKVNFEFTQQSNYGYLKFISRKELLFFESIEYYDRFQKLLLFFQGRSKHFKEFKFKCLGCDEWVSVFYKDGLSRDKTANFINLTYTDLKDDLDKIIYGWFSNDDVTYCVDVILENLLNAKISHSRRFINSIFSFEAYAKRFIDLDMKNPTLEKYLRSFKSYFIQISELKENEIKSFIKKLIRTRNFYVHGSNIKEKLFTDFELLYLSFLLDFIVSIELLKNLGVSDNIIEKVKLKANSDYVGMQRTNSVLKQNTLNQNKE